MCPPEEPIEQLSPVTHVVSTSLKILNDGKLACTPESNNERSQRLQSYLSFHSADPNPGFGAICYRLLVSRVESID